MITINVWIAKDANTVKLTDTDGNVYTGRVVEIVDVGEQSEDYGCGEDCIAIAVDGREIEFMESEIADITILD